MFRMNPRRIRVLCGPCARQALALALAVVLTVALVPDARALAAGAYDTFAPGEVPDYILRYDESLGAYVIDIDAWNRLTPEQKALFDVDFVIENNQTTGETRVVENGQEGYHFGAEDGPEYVPEEAPSDPEAARPILDEPAEKDAAAVASPAGDAAQPASVDLASKLGAASAQGGAPDENGELADGSEGDGPMLEGAATEGPDEYANQSEDDGVGLAAMLAQGEFGSGLIPQAAEGSDITNFGYTGAAQSFVADASADWSGDTQTGVSHDVGYWKLQVYGAQGGSGNSNATRGGYGGYAEGVVRLEDGMGLSVYVGSQGNAPGAGWNGGGRGYYGTKVRYNQYGCGGGGATDIRIGGETLYNRLIVAGGGGGSFRGYAGYWSGFHRRTEGRGGDGGGASGTQGRAVAWANPGGGGGTQYSGGTRGPGSKKYGYVGEFGQGAAAPTGVGKPGAGGGGGWWGGGSGGGGTKNAGKYKATAGGGGSGFTYVGQEMSELVPASGTYLVDPSYALTSASMKVGQRSGSGYATITHLAWNTTFDANDSTGSTHATGTGKARDKTYVTSNDGNTYYAAYTIPGDTPETCGFTREGYTFVGWNTAPDGSGEGFTGSPTSISSDIVLYAQWRPNVYQISLDNADATRLGTPVVYEKFDTGLYLDASCEVPLSPDSFAAPERTYRVGLDARGGEELGSLSCEYAFDGYFTEAAGSSTQMIASSGAPTGDFGVTTVYGDGSSLSASWTSSSVTLPAATRAGYAFDGWYASSDGGTTLAERVGRAGDSYTPAADVTLYAGWTPLIYRIDLDNAGAYDSRGGTVGDPDAARAAGLGTERVFEQYETNVLDSDARDAEGRPTGSVVNAVTAPKQVYQVRYEHMNGVDAGAPALPSAQSASYGFKGYYTLESGGARLIDGCEGGGQALLGDALKAGGLFLGDTTLHAQWDQASLELPGFDFWEGHRFSGWGTAPTGSLTFFREGGAYTPTFDAARATGDATLYAYWKINTYSIDYEGVSEAQGFNPPGAVATGEEDSDVKYNVTFTVPNPVRPGYEFVGWRIDNMDGIEHTIQGEKTTASSFEVTKANGKLRPTGTDLCNLREGAGTVVMTALWQPKVISVALDDAGGTGGSGAVYEEYATNVWKTRTGEEGAYSLSDPLHHATSTAPKGAVQVPSKTRPVTWHLDSVLAGEVVQPDISRATMGEGPVRTGDVANLEFKGYFTNATAGTQMFDAQGSLVSDAFTTTYFDADAAHTLFAQWGNPGVVTPDVLGVPTLRLRGWNTAADGTGTHYGIGERVYPATDAGVELYAEWDRPTYPIVYDATGGVGAPAPVTKSHNVDLTIASETPGWADEHYPGPTITLDANCVPAEGEQASTGAAGDALATVITRTHEFAHWNTDPSGGGTTFAPGSAYTANATATLCAQWKVTDTVGAVELPKATRTGYTFDGWYTSSDGGATLETRVGDEAGRYAPLANETLYAKWVPNAYKVAFHDGDVTLGERSLTYDSAAPLLTGVRQGPGTISANELTATREGWTFAGWESRPGSFEVVYQAAEEVVNLTDAPAGTVDLYALWQRDVTFVGGVEGELSPTSEMAAAPAGDAGRIRTQADQAAADAVTIRQLGDASGSTSVTAPQIAPIGGWDAAGWLPSTSATAVSVALAGETFVPTDVATFYAGHARQVELAYDGNGASFGETAPSLDTQRYNVSGDITMPALVLAPNGFTRDDFYFDKWSMGNPAETVHDWTPQVEEAPRATALAEWASLDEVVPAGYYTINYDPNGGTGHMDSRTVEYADAINLDAPAFTLEGATFKGWNTAPDGTGEFFDDGELVAMLAKPNESITLYARWNLPARAVPTDVDAQDGSDTPKTSDPTTLAAPLALVLAGAALALLGARRRRRE